ncbi:GNAT family N-acetyltransferase [Saccharibacillus deserti]|uniref:GNAT family N-acetyltransferase n=1 Tax=Saccharibacillus deserti TaxID=1634444 RepID=UPI001556FF81|nr:GNAT family N-acetyltransferase [Saccharibacillus deserti]
MSDNEWMRIQAETLYVLDGHKILGINEPGPQPSAPLLFVGRTRTAAYRYFRADLPQALIEEIHRLTREDLNIVQLCRALRTYQEVTQIWIGPAYSIPQLALPAEDSGVCLIGDSNRHVLDRFFRSVNEQYAYRSPVVAVVDQGHAVSVCCSARKSNRAIEASLYTVEAYRGKGLAGRLLPLWSAQVRQLGYHPLYSASWDNLHSQRVAQRLGMVQYGVDLSLSAE